MPKSYLSWLWETCLKTYEILFKHDMLFLFLSNKKATQSIAHALSQRIDNINYCKNKTNIRACWLTSLTWSLKPKGIQFKISETKL